MKKLIISLAALAALAATPAMAKVKHHNVISASAGASHAKAFSHRSINWYGNGYASKRKIAFKKKHRLKKARRHYGYYNHHGYYKGHYKNSYRPSYKHHGTRVAVSGRNFSFRF